MKKPKKYKHLDQANRDRIQAMLDNGHRQKDIARILGVNSGTISREIKRNRRRKRKKGGIILGHYEASVAEHKAMVRREASKYQGKKIHENDKLKKLVIRGLKKHGLQMKYLEE